MFPRGACNLKPEDIFSGLPVYFLCWGFFDLRASYRFRALISCLLAVSLCGTCIGLRGTQNSQAAAAVEQAEIFSYNGLSREAFPALIGPWLRTGKYNPFLQAASPAFPIPELNAGYVPQGMCYVDTLGCFALAAYHPERERPSILSLVDAGSGEFIKTIYLSKPGGLPYTGHAGGVAAWGAHIWVTSDHRAWRLNAEALRQAENGASLRFEDHFRPGTRGGVAFVAEGMLWVGDSYSPEISQPLPEKQRDPDSGNMAWCMGFPLSEDAPMGVKGLKRGAETIAPAAVLSIQNYAQGICLTSSGSLLISVSYTAAAPSWLWIYPTLRAILEQPPARHVSIKKNDCPVWTVSTSMAVGKQMLAPMSEGICEWEGRIFTLYESAALLYRSRAELYADYVFSLDETTLGQAAMDS